MAEEISGGGEAGGGGKAGGGLGAILTRKVGPLPLGVWILVAGVIVWFVFRSNGSSGAAAVGDTADSGGLGVSGSGYGDSGGGGGGTSSSGSDSSGETVGGQYADNSAWARAAVNYLVGLGVDPTAANASIQNWLSGQSLTPTEQGNVNTAVQGIGPPPQLPEPSAEAPPPVYSPSPGTTYAANPPGSVLVKTKTANSVTLGWGRVANATSYRISYGKSSAASDGSVTVGGSVTTAVVGGLAANTTYYFRVQATPSRPGAPYASVTARTASSSSTPAPSGSSTYTVKSGDTLTSIAAKLHTTVSHLYSVNRDVIEAAARAHGKTSSDGGHWIYPGTELRY